LWFSIIIDIFLSFDPQHHSCQPFSNEEKYQSAITNFNLENLQKILIITCKCGGKLKFTENIDIISDLIETPIYTTICPRCGAQNVEGSHKEKFKQ
jgi:hypothetical protein